MLNGPRYQTSRPVGLASAQPLTVVAWDAATVPVANAHGPVALRSIDLVIGAHTHQLRAVELRKLQLDNLRCLGGKASGNCMMTFPLALSATLASGAAQVKHRRRNQRYIQLKSGFSEVRSRC